ncbi:MAG: ATP synthase F1 subunit gamma [Pirellulaceae bacterium]|nr:ATP synthase F1 subunit gamma [Pirellulaceae bacterium]
MANIRLLDKRRKSIRNIRKITRTMELIATARFKKAMDRASAATDYTNRITSIVQDLAKAGTDVSHPLLQSRDETKHAEMVMLTSNRGLCGGYNGSVIRMALARRGEIVEKVGNTPMNVSGKRGVSALKFRGIPIEKAYTQFDDEPAFDEVAKIADDLMLRFISGKIDRVDIVYTKFLSVSKQVAVAETLLPISNLSTVSDKYENASEPAKAGFRDDYEFLPSASSILEEVVPAAFRARLFKCFLDAAVSEQIARMVAMKSATENAGDIIKQLSRTYNRARQSKITQEIMEIIGGVEALG